MGVNVFVERQKAAMARALAAQKRVREREKERRARLGDANCQRCNDWVLAEYQHSSGQKTFCPHCYGKTKEYLDERTHDGICRRCNFGAIVEGTIHCKKCLAYMREYTKARGTKANTEATKRYRERNKEKFRAYRREYMRKKRAAAKEVV